MSTPPARLGTAAPMEGTNQVAGRQNDRVNQHRAVPGRAVLLAVVALVTAVVGGMASNGASIFSSRPADAVSTTMVPASFTSSLVRSEVIGYSAQHRPIVAYELGDTWLAT